MTAKRSLCGCAVLAAMLALGSCSYFQKSPTPAPAQSGIDETSIRHTILAKFRQARPDCVNVPDISVTQGLVVLSGTLAHPLARVDAVRVTWDTAGVSQVIDEIQTPVPQDASFAKDVSLSMKLRTRLTFDPDINSTHYSIESVGGVIYLMGRADNQAELDKVTRLANDAGAVKVVNYVRLSGNADGSKP